MSDQSHHHENVSERFILYMSAPGFVGLLEKPSGRAEAKGICGDSIGVHIGVVDGLLKEVLVQPNGCVYTQVCAGAVSNLARGKSIEEALELEAEDVVAELGGLPQDHYHCARLAVNALGEAIADYYQIEASTKGRI